MSSTTKTNGETKTAPAPRKRTGGDRDALAALVKNGEQTGAKTAPAPKPKTSAKTAPKTAPKTAEKRTTAKPKTTPEKTPDQLAAIRATELLRHGGAYANASGVSASQVRDFAAAQPRGFDALKIIGGGSAVSVAVAVKLANGTKTPTAEQSAAWRDATKRYAQKTFGVNGPTSKNKLTGRKIACVLAAIAERSAK